MQSDDREYQRGTPEAGQKRIDHGGIKRKIEAGANEEEANRAWSEAEENDFKRNEWGDSPEAVRDATDLSGG